MHYICLQAYGATTSAWNKMKPSKIGMEIMNGGYFPFVCKKCIAVTENRCSNMETESVNTVIKSDIINSIDTKLENININMNKLKLNTTTYKTYSEAITNSLDTISLRINKIDSRNKNIIANNK